MMRTRLVLGLSLVAWIGCARVPTELKTAMEKQAAELQQIKSRQKEDIEVLFQQVRVLQLYILAEKEEQYLQKYAQGPKAVKLADNTNASIYTDSNGKALPPSNNPNVDVVTLSTEKMIRDWFNAKRMESDQQLLQAKAEFLKLQDHVDIAQQINAAVTEYLNSLINLRRAQSQLGNNLVQKIASIPGAAALEPALIKLFSLDVKELDKQLSKTF